MLPVRGEILEKAEGLLQSSFLTACFHTDSGFGNKAPKSGARGTLVVSKITGGNHWQLEPANLSFLYCFPTLPPPSLDVGTYRAVIFSWKSKCARAVLFNLWTLKLKRCWEKQNRVGLSRVGGLTVASLASALRRTCTHSQWGPSPAKVAGCVQGLAQFLSLWGLVPLQYRWA